MFNPHTMHPRVRWIRPLVYLLVAQGSLVCVSSSKMLGTERTRPSTAVVPAWPRHPLERWTMLETLLHQHATPNMCTTVLCTWDSRSRRPQCDHTTVKTKSSHCFVWYITNVTSYKKYNPTHWCYYYDWVRQSPQPIRLLMWFGNDVLNLFASTTMASPAITVGSYDGQSSLHAIRWRR